MLRYKILYLINSPANVFLSKKRNPKNRSLKKRKAIEVFVRDIRVFGMDQTYCTQVLHDPNTAKAMRANNSQSA